MRPSPPRNLRSWAEPRCGESADACSVLAAKPVCLLQQAGNSQPPEPHVSAAASAWLLRLKAEPFQRPKAETRLKI